MIFVALSMGISCTVSIFDFVYSAIALVIPRLKYAITPEI